MQARLRRFVQQKLVPGRYPRFGTDQLHAALTKVAINRNATLFVHTAWDEFYNFDGTALTLIRALQNQVGPGGTIAMPAYPLAIDPSKVFDVLRTPTGAGMVPELFRRMRGVERSINLYHSVAAYGPAATLLIRDHILSSTPWDRFSPYARLADLDANILCLGLPRSFGLGTSMHCPESLLYDEIPYFRKVFGSEIPYRYRDRSGTVGDLRIRPRTGRWSATRVLGHIDPREVRVTYVSNLRIQAIGARYLTNRMVELARHGIVNYYWPLPWPRLFKVADRDAVEKA